MAKSNNRDPLDAVLANIEKQMDNKGRPVLTRFRNVETEKVPVIPFGIKDIDDASYCGGVPRGKMVELFGLESSGKSLLSLYLIASAQQQGLECALLDIEQSFEPAWAKLHGVNVDNLVWGNSFDNGESALEYSYQLCKSGAFGLVVIDSTAALTPQSELEGSLEDNARIGEQARLLSRGCRKIRSACGQGNTTCIFINQVRMNVGVTYGNPEVTPGGKALKFYSDQRIRVAPKTKIVVKQNGKDVVVGQISTVTFVKSKVARPYGKAEFKIIFDAKSLNPVVMLCNAARSAKLVRPFKDILNISKGVLGDDKIETGTTSATDLADYLIKNNYVIPLVEALERAVEEDGTLDPIDGAILEMKEDSSKIVSPKDGVILESKQLSDASLAEIGDDSKEEVLDDKDS
jgi:recombination protein RecA